MEKNSWILLKTLLLATSSLNTLKHSKDRKKRGRLIGNLVGMGILYIVIMAYCILTCVGYGMLGIADEIPSICALVISMLAFLFTFLKTNGYLFNFKEYDLLMALPLEAKTVAADKFLYMYIKNLPWYLSIALSMMIGYGIYAAPSVLVYPIWILLSLALPVIPMLAAALLGFLIAKISAGFKKTNIIQTILLFAFTIFCFSLRFIIEAIAKNGQTEAIIESIAGTTTTAGKWYLPLAWFSGAVTEFKLGDLLLFLGVTILLFELSFLFVGKSYRKLNSALKSHAVSKAYKMHTQKQKSILNTIAFKEFKRLTGSTTYMTNITMGEILTLVVGVVVLVLGLDRVVGIVTQDAPIAKEMLYPAIPLIIYFLIGMVSSTVCSPSLEGKNYWIVQSLPIEKKTLYQGKMLFQMYLSVPFMSFGTLCFCISAKLSIPVTLLYLIEGIVLCAFSSAWGCVCGIKHLRLDWENEVEVVKQGAAVAIYLFPNMLVTMGLVVLVVFLGTKMNGNLVSIRLTAIVAVLTILSYLRVLSLAREKDEVLLKRKKKR